MHAAGPQDTLGRRVQERRRHRKVPLSSVFSQVQVKVSPYLVSTAFDPLGPPTEVPKELCFFEKKKLPRGNDEGRARQCGARRRCAAARSFRHWKRS